uniref:Uncharacterized protein n=1 Tax=viral metagenome TaxID=1070528 RepID=A0A6H2A4L5_9ZZZZ
MFVDVWNETHDIIAVTAHINNEGVMEIRIGNPVMDGHIDSIEPHKRRRIELIAPKGDCP